MDRGTTGLQNAVFCHETDNGIMISPLQWLLTTGQSKTRHANKSIIDGCVSQMALLLMNNGVLVASEDRSDVVFSCILTDELTAPQQIVSSPWFHRWS